MNFKSRPRIYMDDEPGAGGGDGGDDLAAKIAAAVEQATAGLKKKNADLLGELKAAKSKASSLPDGFDPEKYETLLAAEAKREEDKLKAAEEWDKLREQITASHQQELSKKDDRIKHLTASLENFLMDSELTTALNREKANVDLLLPHVRQHVQVTEIDGRFSVNVVGMDGKDRYDPKTGEKMDVAKLVTEFKANPVYQAAFSGSGNSGGGAGDHHGTGTYGGGQTNPFSKKTRNVTEQARIRKQDPDLAAELIKRAEAET